MLLKNQIRNEVEIPLYDYELKGIEKIVDEFAVEFGKWIINDAFSNNTIVYTIQDLKKLLEIYKKEKNL